MRPGGWRGVIMLPMRDLDSLSARAAVLVYFRRQGHCVLINKVNKNWVYTWPTSPFRIKNNEILQNLLDIVPISSWLKDTIGRTWLKKMCYTLFAHCDCFDISVPYNFGKTSPFFARMALVRIGLLNHCPNLKFVWKVGWLSNLKTEQCRLRQ